MALNSTLIASDILNRVAVEVGTAPVTNPLESTDPFFIQLRYLLDIAGEELMQAYPWEILVRTHEFTTVTPATNGYALPDDFGYIINNTGWDTTNNTPLVEALTAEQWAGLKGAGLEEGARQYSFRISGGRINILPEPSAVGAVLSFEYISSNWVWDGSTVTPVYTKNVVLASDTPLFDRTLISRALKVKYLESAGFDTTKAQADYNQIFAFLTGTEKGAPILNAGGRRGFPYLNGRNIPFGGFG